MITEKKLKLSIKIQGEPVIAPQVRQFACVWAAVLFWTIYVNKSLSFGWSEMVLALLAILLACVVQFGWQVPALRYPSILVCVLSILFLVWFMPVRKQWAWLFDQASSELADQGVLFPGLLSKWIPEEGQTGWTYVCAFVFLFTFITFFSILYRYRGLFLFVTVLAPLLFLLRTGWEPEIFVLLLLVCLIFRMMPSLRSGVFTIVIISVLCGIFFWGDTKPLAGEEGSSSSYIAQMWEHWKYNESIEVLPEGQLNDAGFSGREEDVVLSIAMDTLSPYYLRGFTGTVFEENAWTNNRETINALSYGTENEASFAEMDWDVLWLRALDGTSLKSLLGEDSDESDGTAENALTITNLNASRRYLYLPYECTTSIKTYEKEGTAVCGTGENIYATGLRGQGEYVFGAYTCLAEGIWQVNQNDSVSDDDAKEQEEENLQAYEEYVYSTCLTLTKEEKEIISSIFNTEQTGSNISAVSVARKIRQWLDDNITYDTEPGDIPEGESFASWFFQDYMCGYDVHYATAAVMLFRYYGIPARYVEGYLVTQDVLCDATDSGEVEVTEQEAHAWAEIYLEEVGWIPVEVMEEYEDLMGVSYLEGWSTTIVSSAQQNTSSESSLEDGQDNGDRNEQNQETTTEENAEKNVTQEDASEKSTEEGGTHGVASGESSEEGKASNFGSAESESLLLRSLVLLFFVGIVYVIFCLQRNRYFERGWENTADYGYGVRMYYFKLCRLLYLAENKTDQKINQNAASAKKKTLHCLTQDSGEERNHQEIANDCQIDTIKRLLMKQDPAVNVDRMDEVFAIRQKAVYSAEALTEEERDIACTFLQQEISVLLAAFTVPQRIKIHLENEKKILFSLQKDSCVRE